MPVSKNTLSRIGHLGVVIMLLHMAGMAIQAMADEHRVTGDAPGAFVVEDGKVDPDTYEGYITYTRVCMACHGPDGLGSSFAPNLVRAAERRGWADFAGTIAAGREVQPGQVMPSFADDPYVMGNIGKIFSYLRARGEGGLGRGRPRIIESMQEDAEPEEAVPEEAVPEEAGEESADQEKLDQQEGVESKDPDRDDKDQDSADKNQEKAAPESGEANATEASTTEASTKDEDEE
jgi:mono/diheme cytochrome c family protein